MVEALSQSQDRLRLVLEEREIILESSIVGIAFLTPQGRFRWANKAMLDIFGAQGRTIQSMEPYYLSREQYLQVGGEVARSVARGEIYETELRMRRSDGTPIWVSLSGKAVSRVARRHELKRRNGELFWVAMGGSCLRPNEPDSGVIWTFLEITEHKKSEAEIREALEQQKALNELRSRFVAMTSHEFRTPLAAILSAEELLRHYGDRLPQHDRVDVLDSIATGVLRMSRMIDRVLLLGKADAGMLEFEPRKLELLHLCRQFVDEARAQQPDSRSEVVTEVESRLGEGTIFTVRLPM